MREFMHGGAAPVQHEEPRQEAALVWDDVRVFFACVEAKSFRKAGDKLGLNPSTVARRIEAVEEKLGYRLFGRVKDGLHITAEGRGLIPRARNMAREFHEIVREVQGSRPGRRGVVKVSITDGLGTFWVMPLLVEFTRQNPNLIVQVDCAVNNADVLRLEADLSIQLVRPSEPDLRVVRLGRLHAYPFASKSYAERYGLPTKKADMVNHRLVDQVGPQMVEGAWKHHLNLESVEGIVGIRSNSSAAVFYAIEKGAGIGALPTFASALDAPVIPVDIDVQHAMDIWLTYGPNARNTESTSHVIDWIKAIFDPVKYPWFRDEFIHPTELVEMAPADTRVQSVRGSFAAKPFQD